MYTKTHTRSRPRKHSHTCVYIYKYLHVRVCLYTEPKKPQKHKSHPCTHKTLTLNVAAGTQTDKRTDSRTCTYTYVHILTIRTTLGNIPWSKIENLHSSYVLSKLGTGTLFRPRQQLYRGE